MNENDVPECIKSLKIEHIYKGKSFATNIFSHENSHVHESEPTWKQADEEEEDEEEKEEEEGELSWLLSWTVKRKDKKIEKFPSY